MNEQYVTELGGENRPDCRRKRNKTQTLHHHVFDHCTFSKNTYKSIRHIEILHIYIRSNSNLEHCRTEAVPQYFSEIVLKLYLFT